jgi:hypothetical protein
MEILDENSILVVYIPATNRAFVWRIRNVLNKNFPKIDYGPLPIPANFPFSSYVGGVIPAPADGVMPMYSYVPLEYSLSFPLSGVYDSSDMWYLPEDYNDRVFHVITKVTPAWLRCGITIPKGNIQGKFQKDKVDTGIDKLFGFSRGMIETIHIPGVHYGYRFGNDSNLNVYTGCRFEYGEYVIETPRDAEFIFNILSRKIKPDKWISLPIITYTIRDALMKNYGIEGFTVYGIYERDKAIREYTELLRKVKI